LSYHSFNVYISVGQLSTTMVNVIKKVGGLSCLIITKTSLWKLSKWFGDVLIHPHSLYPKLNFSNLSKLTLFDTSIPVKTQHNNYAFEIWIWAEDNIFNVLIFNLKNYLF
jgi:hypothetical protein